MVVLRVAHLVFRNVRIIDPLYPTLPEEESRRNLDGKLPRSYWITALGSLDLSWKRVPQLQRELKTDYSRGTGLLQFMPQHD